jgi:NADPH-dependent glutamate synthase beta subunit-like oxidoreductase
LEKDYGAVFLAPGLWSGRTLKMNGVNGAKTTDALSVLCAYRDKGTAEVGKEVLVIGGGSVATDAALAAKASGAGKVSLVCLEKEAEMPALASEVLPRAISSTRTSTTKMRMRFVDISSFS